LDNIVEPEGLIKFLTVRNLVLRQLRRSGLVVANGSQPAKSPVGAASSAAMSLLRSFSFWRAGIYKDAAPLGLAGTQQVIAVVSQGRCRWLTSGVPAGRLEGWLDWIVEREGVIKSLTVRNLT
jgi:hypothetical protein